MNGKHLSDIAWDELQALPLSGKADYFNVGGCEYHVLIAQQFSRERLDRLGDMATRIRRIAKTEAGARFLGQLLSHARAMLYFAQPSSRTFMSFCAACQILGIRISEVRDTATSSEFKGESPEDSIRTFSSYVDMIVMRTPTGGLAERMAWVLSNSERPIPIINAGSGKDQHPTQALLDVYTLQRSFEARGGIDGKRIVFVGDLARGRTVRSLAWLLSNYRDVKQCFVAPPELQIGSDILDLLRTRGVDFELQTEFEKIIPTADAIYMTRVQDEWDTAAKESRQCDYTKYHFAARHLALLRPNTVIMHPFPRRSEIAVEVDADPRAVYWRQMRNGMWIRCALIAGIFDRHEQISDYYDQSQAR